ncbi:hypothetical protein SCOR_01795 [Sulfidibacter corallicola]|uniref:Tetratricopeptide repeat protein n=1 Tax=Sulfidibacter corallicola TaxID=2818388 RepID=A0A8A4TGQ9_SULCO|nr:hypothetical protein [Sulfidibacter corallicola]QTD48740.1 hypothetical protein J3U87_24430 [Sulfidibacter corallicola]
MNLPLLTWVEGLWFVGPIVALLALVAYLALRNHTHKPRSARAFVEHLEFCLNRGDLEQVMSLLNKPGFSAFLQIHATADLEPKPTEPPTRPHISMTQDPSLREALWPAMETPVQFLRFLQHEDDTVAVFRQLDLSAERVHGESENHTPALSYMKIVVDKNFRGGWTWSDIHFLGLGQSLSERYHHRLAKRHREARNPNQPASIPDISEAPTAPEIDLTQCGHPLMRDLMQNGQWMAARRIWSNLPRPVRYRKDVMLDLVRIALNLDDQALTEAEEVFYCKWPEEPAYHLLLLSVALHRMELFASEELINRIDQLVGGDPLLDLVRAEVHIAHGDMHQAKSLLQKAASQVPQCQACYWRLLELSLMTGDHRQALPWLEVLMDRFGHNIERFTHTRHFTSLMMSAYYRQWLESRPWVSR